MKEEPLKVCGDCLKAKPYSSFYRRKDRPLGLRTACKSCGARWKRSEKGKKSTRKYKVSESGRAATAKSKKKLRPAERANKAISRMVKRGTMLKPSECEGCGDPGKVLHGHHYAGYEGANRYKVKWLCPGCHNLAHHPHLREMLTRLKAS